MHMAVGKSRKIVLYTGARETLAGGEGEGATAELRSYSPFRIPVARLAAAQAALEEKDMARGEVS